MDTSPPAEKSGPKAAGEKLGLTLNPELLADVILIASEKACAEKPGSLSVMGATEIGPTSKVGLMPRWIDGTGMDGILIGPMPPTVSTNSEIDGMLMGGRTLMGPTPPLTSAPTAGNCGMV